MTDSSMTDYDAQKDGFESYNVAIAAKRARLLHERCPAAKRVVVIGQCELYLGDCMEIMSSLDPVDAVVTDPPYGIGEARSNNASRSKLATSKDYGIADWDDKPCQPRTIEMIKTLSKWQIIFGGNYFELGPTSCWLVWDKENGENDFADCELAWTNLKKAVRRINWRWHGMIRKGQEERVHPTQKPLGVMEWCLTHVPAAQTVLDPFMGSGTTGVACVKAGRSFIGVEREQAYFDIACDRIRKAYSQPDFFVEQQPTEKPVQEVMF